MTGSCPDVYCLDSSALIDIQRHYPNAIRKLRRNGKEGRIKIVEGVYREIRRKSDKLKTMVEDYLNKYDAVVKLGMSKQHAALARIERTYGEGIRIGKVRRPGLWASKGGRRSADAQVVAACKLNKYICVAGDQGIQAVCHLEDIPCIGWHEFYRQMEHGFSGQGRLF